MTAHQQIELNLPDHGLWTGADIGAKAARVDGDLKPNRPTLNRHAGPAPFTNERRQIIGWHRRGDTSVGKFAAVSFGSIQGVLAALARRHPPDWLLITPGPLAET